jgi:hypothetical protein
MCIALEANFTAALNTSVLDMPSFTTIDQLLILNIFSPTSSYLTAFNTEWISKGKAGVWITCRHFGR